MRFSKSPLYFVPATNAPIFNEKSSIPNKGLFFWFSSIANPSATAVLPTPGSPTNKGLFFFLRNKTSEVRLISLLLPIMGSIFPSLAS